MSVSIRVMNKEDIAAVQDIAKRTWNATYEGIIPYEIQENFLRAAYSDQNMKSRLENSILLVAEVDSNVIGFANYSPANEKGQAELGAIYIYPEYQGTGVGTALLEEGAKVLNGVKEIYIDVERDNEIGTNFYKAKGFTRVSEYDDDFGGHLLKTVRMVWMLP